ncbi:lipopolysaccharide transport periplasmic protein LptA [Xanthomonas graminis]|uniref:Lipopolysaccharide export system protein LptA n=1 Tax=Xanthomonas graminis pv. poae TaxID=227946 RepID=A0A199P5M5_9XANT|nr:lipopolysaccharide transport periplasmic protein LptA [Xanthomonas translucens]OAX56492.1 lipopolysaccharide transport periplasmic protein LptA [Xanthomonas translucens pv. poae]
MNRTLPAKLALLALLLPALAMAKSTDRNQPMDITSANQSGNMLDDNGKIRYTGNVVIIQGTLEIHADTADLFRKDGDIDRVVLTGKQATLKQELDDGSPMDAVADNIDYKVGTDTVVLTGNYRMTSPKGTNAGQRMVYNTKTGDMQGGGDGTRVHTVIQPKNAAPAGAPAAGAKPAAKPPAKPAATPAKPTTPAKQGGQ